MERIDSSRFRGRPRDRSVNSCPKRCAVTFVHESSPKGRPRSTDSRNRLRSPADNGSFTRSNHRESRTGATPRHNNGSPLSQPGKLDHFPVLGPRH